MTRLEKVQPRITPSLVQASRMAADQLRSTQLVTVILSQGLFSLSERLLARTTMESSPVSMTQLETVTSREQFR